MSETIVSLLVFGNCNTTKVVSGLNAIMSPSSEYTECFVSLKSFQAIRSGVASVQTQAILLSGVKNVYKLSNVNVLNISQEVGYVYSRIEGNDSIFDYHSNMDNWISYSLNDLDNMRLSFEVTVDVNYRIELKFKLK